MEKTLMIENARIGFRNFAGKEGKFNPAGRRNFCVFLDRETADTLIGDGWNVKYLIPRDPDDVKQAYLQVTVSYAHLPPRIILVTSENKTTLDEATINILDWAEIENVDLVIRPYEWEVNSKKGVKAYTKTMYVTVPEDEFEKKYKDVPDTASALLEEDAD